MITGLIHALPRSVICHAFEPDLVAGLTAGPVKS
jgi:hypothetical protein